MCSGDDGESMFDFGRLELGVGVDSIDTETPFLPVSFSRSNISCSSSEGSGMRLSCCIGVSTGVDVGTVGVGLGVTTLGGMA